MSERQDELSEDRKFLHDLATPLSVIRLTMRRLLKSDDSQREALFAKILESLEKVEKLHAEQKERLHKREAA